MNNIYVISSLIASIICWLLGILIYVKNSHSIKNKSFSILLISIGIWTLFPFVCSIPKSPEKALFLCRLIYISAIFTPSNFYWAMSEAIRETSNQKTNKILIFSYIISFIFLLFSFSNLFIAGVYRFQPNFFVEPGVLYPLFITFFGIVCMLTFIDLYKSYLKAIGDYRNQIKYLIVAFIIAFIGGVFHTTAPYINLETVPHDIFIILSAIIITYAIIVYRLMDINIAIRYTLSYLAEVFIISVFLLITLSAFGFNEILPAVLASLGIAAGIAPLRNTIKRFINETIFRGRYNYQSSLSDITNIIPTIIDHDKLIKYVTESVTSNMHIEKGVIFIKDDRHDTYSPQYPVGINIELDNFHISGKSKLISTIKKNKNYLIKYDLKQIMKQSELVNLWDQIKDLDTELIIPLQKGDNLTGFFCLSQKGGGDIFNEDDLRILKTIANEMAVVIENIRLYNKLIHTDRQTFLETLSSGVSHEMRNRLVAIRTFIELFPERVQTEHTDKSYLEFHKLALREMSRLTKIIDGLLSYSRAVSSGGEPLNVNSLLEEAILIIQPKSKEKDIEIQTTLDKDTSSLTGDKGRLLQVFINIMQNGIDAMQKGGKIHLKTSERKKSILVSISDTGKGIPKEHLDAIFEPFFTTKHTGTGLGLSIVQRIVKDHSGNIKVTSTLKKGTTFNISFRKEGSYTPANIKPKEQLSYWNVKKEFETLTKINN